MSFRISAIISVNLLLSMLMHNSSFCRVFAIGLNFPDTPHCGAHDNLVTLLMRG